MEGWIFAVALLVVILGFELVAFRYFSDVSLGVFPGPSDPSAAGAAGATGDGAGAGVDTDGPIRDCHNCGATNDDAGTFRYCRHCLASLR